MDSSNDNSVVFALRLAKEDLEELRKEAKRMGLTHPTSLVRMLIKRFLMLPENERR